MCMHRYNSKRVFPVRNPIHFIQFLTCHNLISLVPENFFLFLHCVSFLESTSLDFQIIFPLVNLINCFLTIF